MTQSATLAAPEETSRPVNRNTIAWFELPVRDLARATGFYEHVFQTRLLTNDQFPGLAMFPRRDPHAATGALIEIHPASHESDAPRNLCGQPSTDGAVVYLSCDGQLDAVVRRARSAGATLIEEVAQIPGGIGYSAQFRDLDGNRIGLHAAF